MTGAPWNEPLRQRVLTTGPEIAKSNELFSLYNQRP